MNPPRKAHRAHNILEKILSSETLSAWTTRHKESIKLKEVLELPPPKFYWQTDKNF
jgi:hypothetical protein